MHLILPCLVGLSALAQTPLVSDTSDSIHRLWLSSAISRTNPSTPQDGLELSAGLLSVSRESASPWMPLIHGNGLGNVTLGQGLMVQGNLIRHGWEFSITGTGLRDSDNRITRGRILEFSIVKRTKTGWRWGLEKKPLQWGYGLFGGYLMGDSHDPVPRLVLESPLTEVRVFGVPLGAWGFDTFLGRLEWDRQIPAWISNPHLSEQTLKSQGNLRRPNLSGLRLKAAFGPDVDMTFGVVSKWGGVDASGRDIMQGLSLWNYPLGYLGAETILVAEGSGNSQDPDPNNRFPPNKSFHNISNAVANVEIRVRFPETAQRWFGAKGMEVYLSRGASNVNWQWKDFLKHPFSAWSHDLRYVGNSIKDRSLTGSSPNDPWGWAYAQGTPALVHINDTVGIQWVYDTWDLGLELSDLHNQVYPASTYRVYGNGRNLSGHSRYGDSLGQPLGGEVYSQGFSLGLRLPGRGKLGVKVIDAIRFYRDSPELTSPFVPGIADHFYHAQVDVQWLLPFARVGGSIALERHQADLFIPGNRTSNWILSLGYAVPILSKPWERHR